MISTDEDRLSFDLFQGEEATTEMRRVAIRTARKQHRCFLSEMAGREPHDISPGERYRHEKALIDGDFWGEYRCCLACVDAEIAQYADAMAFCRSFASLSGD